MPHSIWLLIIVTLYFIGLHLIVRRARNVQASQEDQAHNTRGQRASNHQGTTTQAMRGLRSTSSQHRPVGSWAHRPSESRWANDNQELWTITSHMQSQSRGQARSSYAAAQSTNI